MIPGDGQRGGARTELCDVLGLEHPIVQAPIGSATTPDLAAAVSEVGALGTLAITWRDLAETESAIEAALEATDRPFGATLVLDDAAKRSRPTSTSTPASRRARRPSGSPSATRRSSSPRSTTRETSRALERLEALRR